MHRDDLPADFVFGTATAAYQVEGATREQGRGASIWDTFARTPGAILDGSTGDIADDHYHRFLDDIDLMAQLGVDAYRFSISWPRIQPDGVGPVNPAGIAFYRRVATALRERGITPYATLYHWDLPQTLEDRGGWLHRDTADRFADYAAMTVAALGDVVQHWITLNEPWCSSFLSYAGGEHAPGLQVGTEAARAAHHLLLAHGKAMPRIRAAAPDATVGITLNLYSVVPASTTPADIDAARRIDGLANRFFLDPLLQGAYPDDVLRDLGQQDWFAAHAGPEDLAVIAASVDFLGVNYYSRHTTRAGTASGARNPNPGSEFVEMVDTGAPRTHMDWEVHPDGLLDVLRVVEERAPGLPTYVTENGAAYEDTVGVDGVVHDEERRAYLEQHIGACADAVRAGLPLRGYFIWTLLDNFEWAWGYTRRFGIVHVDYATQARTPKASAHWLAAFLGGSLATPGTD